MLSLTRKSDYALVALSYLGQQQQRDHAHDQGEEQAVSARKIADQFGLPLPLLMNILKALSHAGLVTSTRGPQGGYVLAATPSEVSILDVVNAIEGPIRVAMCTPHDGLEITSQGNVSHGSVSSDCSEAAKASGESKAGACCPAAGMCPIEGPIRRLNQQLQNFLAGVTLADLLGPQVDVPLEKVGV